MFKQKIQGRLLQMREAAFLFGRSGSVKSILVVFE